MPGVALVVGVAALATAVGMLFGGSDTGRLSIDPVTPTPQPATPEPGDPGAPEPDPGAPEPQPDGAAPPVGAWDQGAPAPLAVRAGHSTTWTGEEVVVWGGRSRLRHREDGAAYSPRRDSWRRIADAPLRGRTDHAAVWTGEELLVWGGRRSDDFGPLALADGAAYDPAADTWRTLPEAPIGGRWSATAVWTGEELLLWGGRAQRLRTVHLGDGAAYDPAADEWRKLPAPPARARWSPAAVWTGDELVVWGAVSPGSVATSGAAYRPGTDAWRHLGASPLAVAVPAVGAWTGERAVVVTPDETLTYHRGDNRWTRSPAVGVPVGLSTRTVAVPGGVVVLDGHTGRAALAPDGAPARPLPGTGGEPGPPTTGARFGGAWTGSSLVVVGGADGERLRTDVWSPGRQPAAGRSGATLRTGRSPTRAGRRPRRSPRRAARCRDSSSRGSGGSR